MDELTLLRNTRDDSREPSAEVLARGRAALAGRIGSETPFRTIPMSRRRRPVTWAGFSVLGAASVTVVLVATDVLGFADWNAGADPAAASVLHSAAVAAMEVSDPIVAPGQYLQVRTDGAFSIVGNLEEDAERIRSNGGEIQPSDDVSMIESYHDELYVPADRNDDWVWIQCVRTPIQTFGPRSEAFAQQESSVNAEFDADVIRYFPGGVTPGGSNFTGFDTGTDRSVDYDNLPRDPAELLAEIYEMNGVSGQSRDGQALEWITNALERGTAPADFRAALYKAAAQIPGVEITEEQATLNGTIGVAIGRLEPSANVRYDIIIDPETGQFIGEREVTEDGYASFPAGTITGWTAVTTAVTASAPTDTSACDG